MIGSLELIVGPMFSGKTTELVRRVERCKHANKDVEIFKPAIDSRYSADYVVTHGGTHVPARVIRDDASDIWVTAGVEVIGFDEVQFFGNWVVNWIEDHIWRGYRIVASGLDQDFLGRPFGPVPALLAKAESITKLTAVCTVCGDDATRTRRLSGSLDLVEVGGKEEYDAVCRKCYRETSRYRLDRDKD